MPVPRSPPPSWQIFAKGIWENIETEDATALEKLFRHGQRHFDCIIKGEVCTMMLERAPDEKPWTCTQPSGEKSAIRRHTKQSQSAALTQLLSKDMDESRSKQQHAVREEKCGPSDVLLSPTKKSQSSKAVVCSPTPADASKSSHCKQQQFFVLQSNGWVPVSDFQCRQINDNLQDGRAVFDVEEGADSWMVDTTCKVGWVQICKRTGKLCSMKCIDSGPFQAAARMPAPIPTVSVPVHQTTSKTLPWPWLQKESPQHGFRRRSNEKINLVDQLLQDWDDLQTWVLGNSKKGQTMSKNAFVKGWLDSSGMHGVAHHDLIVQSVADMFLKIDVTSAGVIDESMWLHYWLLDHQAPSFHALSQVNEKFIQLLGKDTERLKELVTFFVEGCDSDHDAQLTHPQLKVAAAKWLGSIKSDIAGKRPPGQAVLLGYIEELLGTSGTDQLLLEKSQAFSYSYYDFLNHMLGRRKEKVQLYQYDLSKGGARWLSPLLMGTSLEGIWHTSIVVYDLEFWFGGSVCGSVPGSTPFGTPSKIIDLPEETLRSKTDFFNHLNRVLASEFTAANYDVLTHNCNHFSDAASLFLLNCHIPSDVLQQPEMVMGSWTMQMLRPLLNRLLGNMEGNSLTCSHVIHGPSESESSSVCVLLDQGTLVVWEYEKGWTRIARILAADETAYVLRWVDLRSGEINTARRVPHCQVQVLDREGPSRQKCPSDPSVVGTFGARYHRSASIDALQYPIEPANFRGDLGL